MQKRKRGRNSATARERKGEEKSTIQERERQSTKERKRGSFFV